MNRQPQIGDPACLYFVLPLRCEIVEVGETITVYFPKASEEKRHSYPADRFVWEGGDDPNARWRIILPTESREDYC